MMTQSNKKLLLFVLLGLFLQSLFFSFYGSAQSNTTHGVGTGSPEGAVIGTPGSTYARRDGASGSTFYVKISGNGTTGWSAVGDASSGSAVPAGSIVMVNSGSCANGYTEVSALDGKFPIGTLNANGNVGGTTGASSVTPTFTGTSQNMTTGANFSLLGLGTALTAPSSFTPAGTISAVSIVPASVRMIYCKKD